MGGGNQSHDIYSDSDWLVCPITREVSTEQVMIINSWVRGALSLGNQEALAVVSDPRPEDEYRSNGRGIAEFSSLGVCCCLAEIIAINLDTSSDNSSSDSDNNTSDSSSTSQISTSEEIDYDSPEYRRPLKSLLKWYSYLSDEYKDKGGNESDAKPSFSDISKAKACMLAKAQASDASSKAKVQACGSKAKLQTSKSKAKLQRSPKTLIVKSPVPITNGVLGLANAET
ncbi:hypothetical protein Tco_0851405 [Tanacetum coccineum]